MIFIMSNNFDSATNWVTQYLNYYGIDFFRYNAESEIKEISISIDTGSVEVIIELLNGHKIDVARTEVFWYRRGDFNIVKPFNNDTEEKKRILNSENKKVKQFMHEVLESRSTHKLSSISHDRDVNKLSNLILAENCGMKIPKTIITSSKENVVKFSNDDIITKPMDNNFIFVENNLISAVGTSLISGNMKTELPDKFYISKFQRNIKKLFEVRMFYFFGKISSLAIFSQDSDSSRIDSRNELKRTPNRRTVLETPKNLQEKVRVFMRTLNFETGSLDFIVTPSYDFIFLEVNPIGQFSGVSYFGNFYIEKEIALWISNSLNLKNK